MQPEQSLTVPDQIEALARYLRARYDDDEQTACQNIDPPGLGDRRGEWTFGEHGTQVRDSSGHLAVRHTWQEGEHIALHDPARVLADTKAKRDIIEWAEHASGLAERHPDSYTHKGAAEAYVRVLRCLALPYSGRDDFREEWRT